MNDPGPLLSTLAESAAAIVAIVGGFLVSRLVAISSERDGLRRQHDHTRNQLTHVTAAYQDAYDYRLGNSKRAFTDLVLEDLVGVPPDSVDVEALLATNVPRGSSREEMEPHLEHLIDRVQRATAEVGNQIRAADTNELSVADLEARGLVLADHEREMYHRIVDSAVSDLPTARSAYGSLPHFRMPRLVTQGQVATDLRRLDESIRAEQELRARRRILETDVERLRSEINMTGRLVGVTPAIIVLTLYSLIGIVAPVVVMSLHQAMLADWEAWTLVALFVAGLLSVLGYILWYARTLNTLAGASTD